MDESKQTTAADLTAAAAEAVGDYGMGLGGPGTTGGGEVPRV